MCRKVVVVVRKTGDGQEQEAGSAIEKGDGGHEEAEVAKFIGHESSDRWSHDVWKVFLVLFTIRLVSKPVFRTET